VLAVAAGLGVTTALALMGSVGELDYGENDSPLDS
jgi:hypothetical protein